MNADHLKLLGHEVVLLRLQPIRQFYKEVERTALICDHFEFTVCNVYILVNKLFYDVLTVQCDDICGINE